MNDKVILAFSGGLDTSCILKWLLEKGFIVICVIADVGQEEDLEAAKQKALNIGATDVIIKDVKETFVKSYIWPAVQMGLIYEERYLLGTSLARPCITVALIEAAKQCNAQYISHGATGKGNDQVRFELCAYALMPEIKIIAPWRDQEFCNRFQGRMDLIEYAKFHNIPISAKRSSSWSTDANILHISYESGVLEDPNHIAPSTLYAMTADPSTQASKTPIKIKITFENGLPVKLNDKKRTPLGMLKHLNNIAGSYGIGRVDIVENRYVGLKSRGVYETPGGTVLFKAHQDLEIFCLDREVLRCKQYLRDRMAEYVYNGFWFSPEASYTRQCLKLAQANVSGHVIIELRPGYCQVIARESLNSAKSLYNQELVSMDIHGHFVSQDASGFIAINALRLREHVRAFGSYEF